VFWKAGRINFVVECATCMCMAHLRDLVNGKVVSAGPFYIVIQKNSRRFRLEFKAFKIKELRKQV
jgi:hypothetical protein